MCDMVALAFQTDRTRVASLLLCRDLSGLFYPVPGRARRPPPGLHDDLSDDYEKISRYYCGQLAYLATRLDAMKEGEGTVLDHTCLLFLSNMWAGWKHDNTKLPVLTVGGLGGTLRTGRVLDYYDGATTTGSLQPVPLDHGPHGRHPRPLRRRRPPALQL